MTSLHELPQCAFRSTPGSTNPCRPLVWSAYPPTCCPESVAYSYRWCEVFALNMGSPWVDVGRSTLSLQPTRADATIKLMRLFGGAITLPFSISGFCGQRSGCLPIVAGLDRLFVGGDSGRLSRCRPAILGCYDLRNASRTLPGQRTLSAVSRIFGGLAQPAARLKVRDERIWWPLFTYLLSLRKLSVN